MPNPASYALTQALGLNQQADPVRDRAAAARAALDAIAGGGTPLADIARTVAPVIAQTTAVGASTYSPAAGLGPNADFVRRLKALIAASGGRIKVQGNAWGYRSTAEQARLYAQKPHLAAKPGHSLHEKGLAADLSGDLALAHRLAPQFGLRFPMLNPRGSKYEPWHVQLG